ncbi:MAG: alpha/beta fold hydrolase [Candidatus Nitrosopolaris sp.]|jgi:pimeloyl-ACP methyl ester carboxylesterase
MQYIVIGGQIILVGHSYGGLVITNAAYNNPYVKGLVYVAAFAPNVTNLSCLLPLYPTDC